MLTRIPRTARAILPWMTSLQRTTATQAAVADTYPLAPGSLVHICCTDPSTAVNISNGAEDAVSVQVSLLFVTRLSSAHTRGAPVSRL